MLIHTNISIFTNKQNDIILIEAKRMITNG